MKLIIANSFALSMLDREVQRARPVDPVYQTPRIPRPVDDPVDFVEQWATAGAEVVSVVGHADTAALFSKMLGRPVALNRATIKLGPDELLLVGQYIGPRLPEGATELPAGARIEWWVI